VTAAACLCNQSSRDRQEDDQGGDNNSVSPLASGRALGHLPTSFHLGIKTIKASSNLIVQTPDEIASSELAGALRYYATSLIIHDFRFCQCLRAEPPPLVSQILIGQHRRGPVICPVPNNPSRIRQTQISTTTSTIFCTLFFQYALAVTIATTSLRASE
jgi:hypothetical protein